MNGKAIGSFVIAAICGAAAILYAADGVKAMRKDSWRDAVRYTPPNGDAEHGNVKIVDDVTAE